MAIRIPGYVRHEIIRDVAGSGTPSVFVFQNISDSILVDNIGSNGVYVAFDNTASTGSTNLYVPAYQARSIDLRAGSVSLLGSGGTTPEIQVINLHSN